MLSIKCLRSTGKPVRDTPRQLLTIRQRTSYREHHGDSCAQWRSAPSQRHGQPPAAVGQLGPRPLRNFDAQSPGL